MSEVVTDWLYKVLMQHETGGEVRGEGERYEYVRQYWLFTQKLVYRMYKVKEGKVEEKNREESKTKKQLVSTSKLKKKAARKEVRGDTIKRSWRQCWYEESTKGRKYDLRNWRQR